MAKNIPLGVNIISIMSLVQGIISILLGIMMMALGFISKLNPPTCSGSVANDIVCAISPILPFIMIIGGFFILLMGIFDIIIFRSLRKGRNWARILLVVFSCLSVLMSIFTMISFIVQKEYISVFSTLFTMALNVIIILYFTMNRKVKRFFH